MNNLNMSDKELEDLNRVFYSQAYEIVEDLQDSILRLETDPEDEATLKAIKRYVHTLKGDSNSIGLTTIGTLCHRVEDVLSSLLDSSGHVDHNGVDLLLNCVDTINRLLIESESGRDGTDTKGIMERVGQFLNKGIDSITSIPKSSHCRREENNPIITSPHRGEGRVRGSQFTEYQELQIQDALKNGLNVYEIEIFFHPMCEEKCVAALMVSKRLKEMGEIVSSTPDIEGDEIDKAERVAIMFSSKIGEVEIKKNTFIIGITGEINIRRYTTISCHVEIAPASTDPELDSGPKKVRNDIIPERRSEILRVEAEKVDTIMNLVGELIIGRSMIDQITKEFVDSDFGGDISSRLFNVNSHMERTVADIQKGIMKMRMVQINHVFRRFPKMVRDLSAEKGKVIRLDMIGKETELDKGIVDYIGEPLSHIIRNSIDHGIEGPAYRKSIGKSEEGLITLKAYHESGQIVVEVTDDGRGIDIDGLKKKAVEKSLLNEEETQRLSDADAINLVFLSGLSTSETVSDTSGRGIGMDAVKSAITAMRGSIEVESVYGRGTKFQLSLPLTLAVIKALLFRVGKRIYALPISVIAEVARIMTDDLITVDGKDTLLIRDRIISIINLKQLFCRSEGHSPEEPLQSTRNETLRSAQGDAFKSFYEANKEGHERKFVLVLNIGDRKVGLLSDHLIGQQEIVIKAVEEDYSHSDLIAGASILGDGRIVLILDVHALFRKAVEEEKAKINLPIIPSGERDRVRGYS